MKTLTKEVKSLARDRCRHEKRKAAKKKAAAV